MVKPPGLGMPGTKTSSHWPGRKRTGAPPGGILRRKVRMEGLTSSMWLRTTLLSDLEAC